MRRAIDAVDRGSRGQRGEGSRRELPAQGSVWPWLVPSCWRSERRSSTVSQQSQKHQANMRACFAKFLETCDCAGKPQFRNVSRCVGGGLMFASTRKRPHCVNVGRLVGSVPCFGLVYKSCGTKMAAPWRRRQSSLRWSFGRTAWDLGGSRQPRCRRRVCDCCRSQVVGDAWLWRCDLAVGQVIHVRKS